MQQMKSDGKSSENKNATSKEPLTRVLVFLSNLVNEVRVIIIENT